MALRDTAAAGLLLDDLQSLGPWLNSRIPDDHLVTTDRAWKRIAQLIDNRTISVTDELGSRSVAQIRLWVHSASRLVPTGIGWPPGPTNAASMIFSHRSHHRRHHRQRPAQCFHRADVGDSRAIAAGWLVLTEKVPSSLTVRPVRFVIA